MYWYSVSGGSKCIGIVSFAGSIMDYIHRFEKRRGIDIGPTFVLIHAKPIMGRKYVYMKDGRVTVEKEWQTTAATFALQACVTNDKMLEVFYIL